MFSVTLSVVSPNTVVTSVFDIVGSAVCIVGSFVCSSVGSSVSSVTKCVHFLHRSKTEAPIILPTLLNLLYMLRRVDCEQKFSE